MAKEVGIVVGFGAAGVDVYRRVGEISPGHIPGGCASWSSNDEAILENIVNDGCEMQLGGNVINALAYLASRNIGETHYVGVIGELDVASRFMSRQLPVVGIATDRALLVPNYTAATSIQEQLPESPAMSRDRPSDPVTPFMSTDHIQRSAEDAAIVVVGSFYGEGPVARQVFENVPDSAFMTYIPGGQEYVRYPETLRSLMHDRNPALLPLNEAELRLLYGDSDSSIEWLTVHAGELASHVLCTLGENGALLAHNGDVIRGRAEYVDPELIIDTTGAGDRAAAITTEGLMIGDTPGNILTNVARGTARVIQHIGCTTDLFS